MATTKKERYLTGIALEAIARLLPFAPRDFKVTVVEGTAGTFGVKLEAFTPIGEAILPMLKQQLPAMVKTIIEETSAHRKSTEDGGSAATEHTGNRRSEGTPSNMDAQSHAGCGPGGYSSNIAGRDV